MTTGTLTELDEQEALQLLHRLGKVIRRRRQELNLTQQEFADRTGLHRTYVSNVERGERNVTLLTAVRVAQGLELPFLELMQRAISQNS